MKTEFEDQQIADLFNAEAGTIEPATVSTETIVRRGRTLKRRRTGMLSVVAVVAASGVAYGSFRALQPGSGQLAVSATSSEPTTGASEPAATTIAPSDSVTSESNPVEVEDASDPSFENESLTAQLPTGYRDGFLVVKATPSDDTGSPESTAVKFGFTTDGTDIQPIGSELDVAGTINLPIVHGDTVLLLTTAENGPGQQVYMYWSDDLTSWSEDVIDVSKIGILAELSPTMAELVDVQVFGTTGLTNGKDWVASVYQSMTPSDELLKKLGVQNTDGSAGGLFTSSGLMLTDDSGTDRMIPAEELGVTEADLAPFDDFGAFNARPQLIAGQLGQPGFQSVTAGPAQWMENLGESFAGLTAENQLIVSDNGADWSPLAVEIAPGEQIDAIAPLDGDLLLVASTDSGAKSYRVTRDGATTFLSDVPLPPDTGLQPISSGEPIFTTASYDEEALTEDFVMTTKEYEVTIGSPAEADPTGTQMHYVIRDLATGEIVAENTREYGVWMLGEEIDGELVVTFTDAEGRPDVLIPSAEMDAAEEAAEQEAEQGTGTGAADTVPSSLGEDSAPGGEESGFNQLATADGIHWYTERDQDVYLISVNGNKLLASTYSEEFGDEESYKIIDLDVAAAAKSG